MSVTTTGGNPTVVLAAFAALFVAAVLSLALAVRLYRGYRERPTRPKALLGAGLVSLTTVPILLRVVLSNVPVAAATRNLAVTVAQLVGLVVILVVVYDR